MILLLRSGMLLLSAVCLLPLIGCWSRIEVNDRAFVTGIFIDRTDNGEYEVSLKFPLTTRMSQSGSVSSGGHTGNGNPYTIVTKNAESIPIAVRKIRSDLSRELSWGHCRVIVFGRKAAEAGVDQMLEFATRQPDLHTKTYVMVSATSAKDISYMTPVFERFPSEVLREFANRHVTLDTSVRDFLEAKETGGDLVAPLLVSAQANMLSEKGMPGVWVGTDGAAIMKAGKMVGTLDVKGMRASLWIKGKMKDSMISVSSPTDGKIISFHILSSNSSVKPVINNGQIEFHLEIHAIDDVTASDSNINLADPDQIKNLQVKLSEQLYGRIMKSIEKTQRLGVDAFGLGQYLEWRYPKVWRQHRDNWRETYKNCKVRLTVDVYIRRIGEEKNPISSQIST
ncbi:Ger(x)C family spore germination protein [Paenibacillus thalictri]|uniref:Ger(X)C family spore germination protein n=1 Tax=Paenibacillus thalictri TaxID=2527873 RepID=A0A4Q9DL25_9BACL|nr:Ger(x)C family spore germination protein [Paenibacillus thalictri]TBL75699.1 Ger(x)C family spore germination protein [Paenibacillus thalictri]